MPRLTQTLPTCDTLLEYVLARHLGPAKGHGDKRGVSYWLCPVCGEDTFHTLPTTPIYPHRAKCWRLDCDFRGDVGDMLKHFYPSDDYGRRQDRLETLMQEFSKQQSPQSEHIAIGRAGSK